MRERREPDEVGVCGEGSEIVDEEERDSGLEMRRRAMVGFVDFSRRLRNIGCVCLESRDLVVWCCRVERL